MLGSLARGGTEPFTRQSGKESALIRRHPDSQFPLQFVQSVRLLWIISHSFSLVAGAGSCTLGGGCWRRPPAMFTMTCNDPSAKLWRTVAPARSVPRASWWTRWMDRSQSGPRCMSQWSGVNSKSYMNTPVSTSTANRKAVGALARRA